jgi:hypothetical protein
VAQGEQQGACTSTVGFMLATTIIIEICIAFLLNLLLCTAAAATDVSDFSSTTTLLPLMMRRE